MTGESAGAATFDHANQGTPMPRQDFAAAGSRLALAVAALLTATTAGAAVICNNTPHALTAFPSQPGSEGYVLNLVTDVSGDRSSAVPGADIRFERISGTVGVYGGSVEGGIANNAIALASGTSIGPSSQFIGSGNMSGWMGDGFSSYLGLRFLNEQTGQVNYGWMLIELGFSSTIHSWCYDNNGAEIATGFAPVTLQSFSID